MDAMQTPIDTEVLRDQPGFIVQQLHHLRPDIAPPSKLLLYCEVNMFSFFGIIIKKTVCKHLKFSNKR